MKKIGKLQVNPEKLMKNEELMALRGGYSGNGPCTVVCYTDSGSICLGYLLCLDDTPGKDCTDECQYAFSDENAYATPSSC